jgi:ATP-dependent Clp protease ATP-binding subunit ClpB
LLQLLDDGRLTDGHGRTVDFRNSVVIMTSNIGSAHIQEVLEGKGKKSAAHWGDENKELKAKVMEDMKAFFKPEFLNRIDEIVIFNALNTEMLKRIVEIQVSKMKKYLIDKKIDIVLTEEAKAHIASAGFDPVYGARPLKRAIQSEILNPLALRLLDRSFVEGDLIQADCENEKIIFNKLKKSEVG